MLSSRFCIISLRILLPYKSITLDYQMDFFKLIEGPRYVSVGDVMDIKTAKVCYTYA